MTPSELLWVSKRNEKCWLDQLALLDVGIWIPACAGMTKVGVMMMVVFRGEQGVRWTPAFAGVDVN